MKEFTVKDNKKIQLTLEADENCEGKKVITAYDDRDLHQIGFMNFKIKGDTAYIWSFRIDDEEFLRTGVGTVMLNCFEDYACRCRAFRVDGRFYPNGAGAEFSKDFYIKHDYDIYRDGYEQYIYKRLNPTEIKIRNEKIDYSLKPNEQPFEQ